MMTTDSGKRGTSGSSAAFALNVRSLTRRFDGLVAVDGLNLTVQRAAIFGLLGSNGAGKSTSIRMLITLLPPSSGTASVAGYDIVAAPREVRNHGWNDMNGAAAFVRQLLAVAESDLRKLKHDPTELFTRMVQPVLWLVIFGEVFAPARAIPTGGVGYLDFLTPGILAQSVLFAAIFYGISVIWERDLGVLTKFLVSPAPRIALVLGRAFSSSVRGLTQAAALSDCRSISAHRSSHSPCSATSRAGCIRLSSRDDESSTMDFSRASGGQRAHRTAFHRARNR